MVDRKKKPIKKKKVVKKKKPVKKKKKSSRSYIADDTFSDKELKEYMNAIKKVRAGKRTKKQKKVGLTNTISFLNLLFNANKERQKKPTKNLMYTHPFNYPSIISDHHINDVWKATKLPASKTRNGMVNNLNNVYQSLVGYKLLKPDLKDAKKSDVKGPHLKAAELPKRPARAPSPRRPRQLPSRPSHTPQMAPTIDSEDDLDSSSSDDEEDKRK